MTHRRRRVLPWVLAVAVVLLSLTAPVTAQTATATATPAPTATETPQDPQGIFELWDNYTALVAVAFVVVLGGLGAAIKR